MFVGKLLERKQAQRQDAKVPRCQGIRNVLAGG